MKTLKQVMETNENFRAMVKVAPNLRFDEGQALDKWFLNCVKEWLTTKRSERYYEKTRQAIAIYDELLSELDSNAKGGT